MNPVGSVSGAFAWLWASVGNAENRLAKEAQKHAARNMRAEVELPISNTSNLLLKPVSALNVIASAAEMEGYVIPAC